MASFPEPEDEPTRSTNGKRALVLAISILVLALLCCYGISALEDFTLLTEFEE